MTRGSRNVARDQRFWRPLHLQCVVQHTQVSVSASTTVCKVATQAKNLPRPSGTGRPATTLLKTIPRNAAANTMPMTHGFPPVPARPAADLFEIEKRIARLYPTRLCVLLFSGSSTSSKFVWSRRDQGERSRCRVSTWGEECLSFAQTTRQGGIYAQQLGAGQGSQEIQVRELVGLGIKKKRQQDEA